MSEYVERWRPVVGFEGLYEVSDLGRVQSLQRNNVQLLRQYPSRSGHVRVRLFKDGQSTQCFVHRLVLEAFIGPCPQGQHALHNKNDPTDNRVSNLRWGTQSENIFDTVREGTHRNTRKTHCIRNHPLEFPNMRIRKTSRDCLACSRAISTLRNRDAGDLQLISDIHYWNIMTNGTEVLLSKQVLETKLKEMETL